MQVAVTGATGFIGTHLAAALIARGHAVNALIRPSLSVPSSAPPGCRPWLVNLSDSSAVEHALRESHSDTLLHLAWSVKKGYLLDVDRNLRSLEASCSVIRASQRAGIKRIVITGTCLESVGSFKSPYSLCKQALHTLTLQALDRANTACAHIFSPFGPGERADRAVPMVARALLRNEPISVGDGTPMRDYVYVVDVANALAILAESSHRGAIDVCSGESRPMREIFQEIGRITGQPHLIKWSQERLGPSEAYDTEGDPTPMQDLGWQAAQDFTKNMELTVDWWRREPLGAALGNGAQKK